MNRIHLIDGGVGSVGKSLFCRVLIQYHCDRHRPYTFVEADQDNPDVAMIYPDRIEQTASGQEWLYVHRVQFSELTTVEFDPNQIFELALSTPVIVNLPFHAFHAVNAWLANTGAIEQAQSYQIRFCKWFVTNGRPDSFRLLAQSLQYFQGAIDHVLVCNRYFRKSWVRLLEHPPIAPFLSSYQVPVIALPRLQDEQLDYLDRHHLPFCHINQMTDLKVLERQRIQDFLRLAYQNITSVEFYL